MKVPLFIHFSFPALQGRMKIPAIYDEVLKDDKDTSSVVWSLNDYQDKARKEKGEQWDELEKSIISNIADNVLVNLQGDKVEIVVKKDFKQSR